MARARRDANDQSKEPFVSAKDRPEVQISLDTPLTELRVRDLSAILGFVGSKSPFEAGKTSLKDFFDKDFPEIAKDWLKEIKIEKAEKPEKPEKFEKNEKLEKPEKEKIEKLEKRENKDVKFEKLENDGTFDPGVMPGPDPRIEQIISAVAGLANRVSELTDQVEELRKRSSR